VKVLFFASLRETMACSEMVLTSDQPETVKALMAQIFLPDGQSLASYAETESLLLAVNQQMVDGDAPLNANDEVAFFPPVTGG
jgi:molybdopterin synthase sulfur carrier subunit